MKHSDKIIERAYLVGMTIISMLTIYFAWDGEDGVLLLQLALVVGGMFMGHVLTEMLNENDD